MRGKKPPHGRIKEIFSYDYSKAESMFLIACEKYRIDHKIRYMRAVDYFKILWTMLGRDEKEAREKRKSHRQICSLCHEVSRVGFSVPDDVWELATHISQRNSIICLRCFTRMADERQVEWDKKIEFYPVSWITHISRERPADY